MIITPISVMIIRTIRAMIMIIMIRSLIIRKQNVECKKKKKKKEKKCIRVLLCLNGKELYRGSRDEECCGGEALDRPTTLSLNTLPSHTHL